jgi:hypothetical protein
MIQVDAPIHLTIENVNAEFQAEGWHHPAENGQCEEFEINHLWHTSKENQTHDWITLMEWPSVNREVIKQLQAIKGSGDL